MAKSGRRLINTYLLIAALVLVVGSTAVASFYLRVSEANPVVGWIYLGAVGVGSAILLYWLGRGWLYLRGKRRAAEREARGAMETARGMSDAEVAAEVERELARAREIAAADASTPEMEREIEARVGQIKPKLESRTLEIVAFGTINSGKSALMNMLAGADVFTSDVRGGTTVIRNEVPWPGHDRVRLVDTPGLGEVGGEDRERIAAEAAKDADLVLFVVEGPLRDFEMSALAQLREKLGKRVVICLNKSDWYSAEDRERLLEQIAELAGRHVAREDIVAVRSHPAARTRVRVLPDGREVEETVEVEPDIAPLAGRMMEIVKRDGRDLLMANLLLRARGVVHEARESVRELLDKRAREIVWGYVWKAGLAAAVNPLPVADLGVAFGLLAKMGLELGRVYRQDVDPAAIEKMLGELKRVAATMGTASLAASAIKSFPGMGTLAGGAMQGLTQALMARWVGKIFIEYFRHDRKPPEGSLEALARAQWEGVTKPVELDLLIREGMNRLTGGEKQSE
jgi:uncharacterized protein